MYALFSLLGALTLWAAVRVWDRGLWPDWLLYILFMTAGLLTLYLYVSVLIIVNIVWLFWAWRRADNPKCELIYWSTAQVLILVLYAPWLIYALGRIPTWSSANPVSPGAFVKMYWTVLTMGISLNVDQYAVYTLPVLTIFLGGTGWLLWHGRHQLRQLRLTAIFLIGLSFLTIVVYLVSLPKETFFYAPPVAPRHLVIFLSAYVVLLAWGLMKLGDGRRWPLLGGKRPSSFFVALACLNGYHQDRMLIDDYKSLTRTIAAYRQPTDANILYTDED